MSKSYHPETYWSEVASRIKSRTGKNVIAGDDEPYYRYKREKFLNMLSTVNFNNKSILEVGCGPGGNLNFIYQFAPKRLVGVDISNEMVELAKSNVLTKEIEIYKIDGISLPFAASIFDVVITATVLQHNTNDVMMRKILAEIGRVSKKQILLFEKTDKTIRGDELCLARPVSYYQDILNEFGYQLVKVEYINIYASYLMSGIIRKLLNPKSRKEGESLNKISVILQKLLLPITKLLDYFFKVKKDVAKMEFVRA